MRSIRLSLIVYFLVLLGLGLGAVSLLAYQTTQESLRAKERKVANLLRGEHARQCDAERKKLDHHLEWMVQHLEKITNNPYTLSPRGRPGTPVGDRRGQAGGIAGVPGGPSRRTDQSGSARPGMPPGTSPWKRIGNNTTVSLPLLRFHIEHHSLDGLQLLSLLSAAAEPHGLLLAPHWTTPWTLARPWLEHTRPLSVWVEFADGVFPGNTEGHEKEYCEVFGESGTSWQRSHTLGDQSFDLDQDAAEKMAPGTWHLDDFQFPGGAHLRRITYRSHGLNLPGWIRSPGPPRSWSAPSGRSGASRRSGRTFFIVFALDAAERDKNLAMLDNAIQKQLDDQAAESRRQLSDLSRNLLTISLITFALTVVGGYGLVRFGLSPLRHLSEAVSRISPRDFRLPLENRRLPAELTPIVLRLEETLGQLKRAFAREKQAAADISHELRTPVAALLTTLEVALRKPRSPEQYRQVLEDCRASGEHMSQLVERLLALARLDAGVDKLRPRDVDAAEVAQQCVNLVRPLAEARGLRLELHDTGPACLKTDPDKLREVVTNLLHNAIEYNKPAGSVDLTVARDNGHLRVEVRDTGIGIAPEAREHIFERFYRADPAREADGLHAGLGLAIVKGYVDLMGGSIAVESAEGQGSTFRLRLPAERCEDR